MFFYSLFFLFYPLPPNIPFCIFYLKVDGNNKRNLPKEQKGTGTEDKGTDKKKKIKVMQKGLWVGLWIYCITIVLHEKKRKKGKN